jgi:uncharacterized protein
VHGDETCGTKAIKRMVRQLNQQSIMLTRGTATFVPVCNPQAYKQGERFVDRNLNRDMVVTEKPDSYEGRVANELCPLIDKCDVLLDIHSYHAGGEPFAIINEDAPRYTNFASALNARWVISGWTKAYLNSAPKGAVRSETEHIGTTERAYNNGAIDVTLECGQHRDPRAIEIACNGITRALAYLEMMEPPHRLAPAHTPHRAVMTGVVYNDGATRLEKPFKHLEIVRAGEIIARRGQDVMRAEAPEVVLLPRPDAPVGAELFYRGRLLDAPAAA